MKKKFLNKILLILVVLQSLPAAAYDCEVDGIYYNLYSSTGEAEVTYYNTYTRIYKGSITIPATITCNSQTYNVTSIGNSAFYYCQELTSITIPSGVTKIGRSAFERTGLSSIIIPNSVSSIGNTAFGNCPDLTAMVVAEDNPVYDSREGCNAIIESSTNMLIAGCSNSSIPNSVTSIGNSAFFCCYDLTSIKISNNVTNIGKAAFYGCI